MNYVTVYETTQQNQVILIKNILEQNDIDYRFFDESSNTNFLTGVRIQVEENQREKALAVFRENGLLNDPSPSQGSVTMAKFWIWLVITLFFLVAAAVFINMLR